MPPRPSGLAGTWWTGASTSWCRSPDRGTGAVPPAQATVEGRLLVEAMLDEHEILTRLLREVADAADLQRAAASAAALRAVYDSP